MMKLIFITQYLLLSGGWYLFRLVPLRFAYTLGYGIGVTLYTLCAATRRARVTRDNLLITKMAKTRAEATRIARASWGHFFGHISEAFRMAGKVTHDNWREYVELEMSPSAEKLLFSKDQPVILATGHHGAWEAGIVAISSARPFFAVARMMDNPYLQRFLDKHNFRGGATIIPKKHGFTGSAMHKWMNSNGALTVLFDQHAGRGVPVPFFGHVVPTYTSPARLHLRSKAPVLVGGFVRTGYMKFKLIVVGEPIEYNPELTGDEALKTLTAEFIARLEHVIRKNPEQYLWMHRRWRGIPVPQVPKK
jgi:KDO2-lipid IV(A) lauroyltransferase